MSRFLRDIFNVLGVVLLAGLLGFGVYYDWIYWSSDRVEIANQYLIEAENKVANGDSDGGWDLAKAYMLGGVDKAEYHRKEGIYLAKLAEPSAYEYLSNLIELGNVDDEVWYEYSQILMDMKEFDRAEYVINQISDEVDDKKKIVILSDLAYIEGTRGRWGEVGKFLEKVDQIAAVDERSQSLLRAYALMNGEINTEWLDVEQVQKLNDAQGDLFVMMVANIWMDLGMTDWARSLLSDLYWQSHDLPDLDQLFARSYLLDGDCAMAEVVVHQLENRIGKNTSTMELREAVRDCWDY